MGTFLLQLFLGYRHRSSKVLDHTQRGLEPYSVVQFHVGSFGRIGMYISQGTSRPPTAAAVGSSMYLYSTGCVLSFP
jgi:hypothetical protein